MPTVKWTKNIPQYTLWTQHPSPTIIFYYLIFIWKCACLVRSTVVRINLIKKYPSKKYGFIEMTLFPFLSNMQVIMHYAHVKWRMDKDFHPCYLDFDLNPHDNDMNNSILSDYVKYFNHCQFISRILTWFAFDQHCFCINWF